MDDPLIDLDFDDLHTIGFLGVDWIQAHCRVPGGVYENEPLVFRGWQLETTVNHYRIRPDAVYDPYRIREPFFYRRSIIVGPQKSGKSPMGAGLILLEGVGPSLFGGWAERGEYYACADHGCTCGWEYEYEPGEAKGIPRRKSLIGLLAYAESQTQNVYEPLQTMIRSGPLDKFVAVREGHIGLPNYGKIIPLSAAAKSKLGQPLTAALADESGLYTEANKVHETWKTMRRGLAAMQGRSLELTNPWDPMENSSAQRTFNSLAKDVYRYYKPPPVELDYSKKKDRAIIHAHVYADSPWVDPASVDAEANEMVEDDPTQAERFFGNRLVQGKGSFLTEKELDAATLPIVVPEGTAITLGFDGSRSGDWTALFAETIDGHQFLPTYGSEDRPTFWNPEEWEGRIPRGEVDAAVAHLKEKYKVARVYIDPLHWETQADQWANWFGGDVVSLWPTNQRTRMFEGLTRYREDLREGLMTLTDDHTFRLHALAARKVEIPGDKYILGKPSKMQKIDILMAAILAHEAAADMRATGWDTGPYYIWLDDEDDDFEYDQWDD